MTDLAVLHRKTLILVARIRSRAADTLSDAGLSRWRRRALTEIVISDLWQVWNDFVREILLASCRGCTMLSGAVVPARPGNNSWNRVAYEAKVLAVASRTKNRPRLHAKRTNSYRYQDPTWGDLNYIVDIVLGLNLANVAALNTALGATSRGLKDLQTVRNACFHKNHESWQSVKDTEKLYFSSSDTRDASELAWKFYIGKSTAAFFEWADAVISVCSRASR